MFVYNRYKDQCSYLLLHFFRMLFPEQLVQSLSYILSYITVNEQLLLSDKSDKYTTSGNLLFITSSIITT